MRERVCKACSNAIPPKEQPPGKLSGTKDRILKDFWKEIKFSPKEENLNTPYSNMSALRSNALRLPYRWGIIVSLCEISGL